MTLHLIIQWDSTHYYDGGQRCITLNWKHPQLPLQGHKLNVVSFIKNSIKKSERFVMGTKETNVFEYIKEHYAWEVEKVIFENNEDEIEASILIKESFE